MAASASRPNAAAHDLKIRKFDLSKIEHGRMYVFIGASGGGKTCLVEAVLNEFRDYQHGLIFSATESLNGFYSHHYPGLFIHETWKPELIQQLFDGQGLKMQAIDKKRKEIEYCKRNKRMDDVIRLEHKVKQMEKNMRAFLVLDDMIYDPRVAKSDVLRLASFQSRHHKVSVIIVIQFSMLLPTYVRANVGYCFFTRENIISNRKRLHDHFAGVVTFDVFNRIMDTCTQNYECLVVDRLTASTNPSDVLFWYKATPPYYFKLGSPAMWKLHQKLYDADHVTNNIKRRSLAQKTKGVQKA